MLPPRDEARTIGRIVVGLLGPLLCDRDIGLGAMAEVDLGERRHRYRRLYELAPQARSVARAILEGAGIGAPEAGGAPALPSSYHTAPVDRRRSIDAS